MVFRNVPANGTRTKLEANEGRKGSNYWKTTGKYLEIFWKKKSNSFPAFRKELKFCKYLYMAHKYLIIEAFKKAGEELKTQGIKKPSQQKKADLLSDFVRENEKLSMDEKNYRNYYTEARRKEGDEDISIKKIEIIQGLTHYLGFATYEEFVAANTKKKEGEFPFFLYRLKKNGKVIFIIIIVSLVGILFFTFIDEPKWMVWKEDHYEETAFDTELFREGLLKIYHKEKVENFKKIETNCETSFFDEKGRPQIWYYKRSKDELECFTQPGLHPVNGKTLKKITSYMIGEHICPNQ